MLRQTLMTIHTPRKGIQGYYCVQLSQRVVCISYSLFVIEGPLESMEKVGWRCRFRQEDGHPKHLRHCKASHNITLSRSILQIFEAQWSGREPTRLLVTDESRLRNGQLKVKTSGKSPIVLKEFWRIFPAIYWRKPSRCQHVLDELCPKISSDTGFPFLKNYGNLVSFKLDAMEQSKFADFILSNCCLLLLSSHSILKASTCQHLDNWKLYHILLSLWFSFMPWSHVLKYTGVAIVYEQNSVCLEHGKTCNNDHMYVCMYVMIKIIILFKKSSTEFDLLNACIFGLRS